MYCMFEALLLLRSCACDCFIFRRAVLPIQLDLEEKEDMDDTEGVDEYAEHMQPVEKVHLRMRRS